VLAGGALLLRLHAIGRSSLWLDEGYTLLFSGMPLPKLLTVGGAHEHPPLYYLIVHALRRIHENYLLPRYVSAVCGSLSLLVLYALGSRLHSRTAGLVAAVLAAVAPFHVWFSRDGRGYELAGLVVLLSYYCLFTALDRPRPATWAAYAVVTSLCLYTEYTTAFALAAQILIVFRAQERGVLRPLILSWVAAVVLFLPWVTVVALDAASIAGNYWIPAPTVASVSATVLEFLGLVTSCSAQPCTGAEAHLPLLAGHNTLVAAAVALAALGVGAFAIVRRRLVVGLLVAWLVGTFALLLLISVAQSLFLDRVVLDATFPLYLLLGMGVAALRRAPLPGGLSLLTAGGIAVASLGTLRPIYAGNLNPDWKSAMRDLAAAYRPGQGVAFYPGALRSLDAAYLPPGWHATRDRPMWSRVYVDVPGWQKRYPLAVNPTLQERQRVETELRDRQLAWVSHATTGTWLVTEAYPGITDVRRWFATHGFSLIMGMEYNLSSRIELWSQQGPASFGVSVARLFDGRWARSASVTASGRVLHERRGASVRRSFSVTPGQTYSIDVTYRGAPPSRPQIGVLLYDAAGRQIDTFPRDNWYDLPTDGVWIRNPFGFVVPPNAVRAMLYLGTKGGPSTWRDVAVYRER
jgi:4-amino-4-deoxy-L-arabinose transferase-like glycosyltransferase